MDYAVEQASLKGVNIVSHQTLVHSYLLNTVLGDVLNLQQNFGLF